MIQNVDIYLDAINSFGDYSFSFIGELKSYEDIDWTYPDQIASKEDVEAKYQELLTNYQNTKYQRDRALAYPSWQDQLDTIYHQGIDAWKAEIQAIKNQYPKP